MSKKISAIILAAIIALSMLVLASCNQKTEEKVDISTTLTVDDSFVGKRTMVMTFPQSVIKTGSDAETNLEKVVQKYCPNALTPSKGYSDGKIQYSFELAFESKQEYIEKTSRILGAQSLVSFSHPNTIMTQGCKLEENFKSEQLLTDWISQGAKTEGFGGLEFKVEEKATSVSLNDDTQRSEPVISVNCLEGYARSALAAGADEEAEKAMDSMYRTAAAMEGTDSLLARAVQKRTQVIRKSFTAAGEETVDLTSR